MRPKHSAAHKFEGRKNSRDVSSTCFTGQLLVKSFVKIVTETITVCHFLYLFLITKGTSMSHNLKSLFGTHTFEVGLELHARGSGPIFCVLLMQLGFAGFLQTLNSSMI